MHFRRKSGSKNASERGFTLIEILVALAVMTIGMMGTMAMYTSITRSTAVAQQMDRSVMVGEQLMEELRGMSVSSIQAMAQPANYTDRGITYTRQVQVTAVTGQSNLVVVRVTISFGEDNDTSSSAQHTTTFEMMRTLGESL